ncbi:MAG TPA: 1,6-anhydro-N-acetylmuramyl-L-alanine amidase AmpD [Methylophilaceae bacterium]
MDKHLSVSTEGWLDAVQHILSPNQDTRPEHTAIELLVIHNISLPPSQYGGDGVVQLFTNCLDPEEHPYYREIYQRKVSAHFFIRRDGTLIQFVACLQRAWHAGASSWQGRENCNDFSIGIELEGSDFETFESKQYEVLNRLIAVLENTYPITGIVGHSDIAPSRKTDPGDFFDWGKVRSRIRSNSR